MLIVVGAALGVGRRRGWPSASSADRWLDASRTRPTRARSARRLVVVAVATVAASRGRSSRAAGGPRTSRSSRSSTPAVGRAPAGTLALFGQVAVVIARACVGTYQAASGTGSRDGWAGAAEPRPAVARAAWGWRPARSPCGSCAERGAGRDADAVGAAAVAAFLAVRRLARRADSAFGDPGRRRRGSRRRHHRERGRRRRWLAGRDDPARASAGRSATRSTPARWRHTSPPTGRPRRPVADGDGPGARRVRRLPADVRRHGAVGRRASATSTRARRPAESRDHVRASSLPGHGRADRGRHGDDDVSPQPSLRRNYDVARDASPTTPPTASAARSSSGCDGRPSTRRWPTATRRSSSTVRCRAATVGCIVTQLDVDGFGSTSDPELLEISALTFGDVDLFERRHPSPDRGAPRHEEVPSSAGTSIFASLTYFGDVSALTPESAAVHARLRW